MKAKNKNLLDYPRSFCLRFDGDKADFENSESYDSLKDSGRFWLNFLKPTEKDYEFLKEKFGIHELAIKDLKSNRNRPKYEAYDKYLFTIITCLNFNKSKSFLDLVNLNIFLKDNFIITVQLEPLLTVSEIYHLLQNNNQILKSSGDVFYRLVDGTVDKYFDIVNSFDDTIDNLQELVLESSNPDIYEDIFTLKKEVALVRKIIMPQRELVKGLLNQEHFQLSNEIKFGLRDVYDHLLILSDFVETNREISAALLDTHLTKLSNKMNKVMQLMSIIATLMLPLTFLTGLFGMNFRDMPGLAYGAEGFWALIAIMLTIVFLMFYYFKKKDFF